MTLGEYIKEYRQAAGMSQRALAKKSGLSNTYISLLEKGTRESGKAIEPTIAALRALADAMGITLDALIAAIDDTPVTIEAASPSNILPVERVKVPLLGSIAAGQPIYADEDFDTTVEVNADLRCDFALRVEGDSMEPRIQNGDIVFVRQQDDVDDGQIAAILIDDSATLKHVYHIPNGLNLTADNPLYAPMIYTYPDVDCIRILGLAVALRRKL